MLSHSKLPWAITATPKGSKQITDARGGVVANLTALDMASAELIVASVNNAGNATMTSKITDINQLERDKQYWAIDKKTGKVVIWTYDYISHIDGEDDTFAIFNNIDGTTELFNDDLRQNDVDLYGPIVTPNIKPALNQNVDSGIMHITNPDDLREGEKYWLVDKTNDMYRTDICRTIPNVDNTKHFGNRIWASSSNPQAFERWNIFGPIPAIQVPDFKALMTKK